MVLQPPKMGRVVVGVDPASTTGISAAWFDEWRDIDIRDIVLMMDRYSAGPLTQADFAPLLPAQPPAYRYLFPSERPRAPPHRKRTKPTKTKRPHKGSKAARKASRRRR